MGSLLTDVVITSKRRVVICVHSQSLLIFPLLSGNGSNRDNQVLLIFNTKELFSEQKRLASHNLSGTYQEEPSTRPPT